jgi:hypothetical protein
MKEMIVTSRKRVLRVWKGYNTFSLASEENAHRGYREEG